MILPNSNLNHLTDVHAEAPARVVVSVALVAEMFKVVGVHNMDC